MVLLMRDLPPQLSAYSRHRPSPTTSDEGNDMVLDDSVILHDSQTKMATYDHHSEHFDGSHAFIPAGHAAWHGMPSGNGQISFSPMHQQNSFFPASSAAHYQSHTTRTPEYTSHDAHWQYQTPLASAPQSNPFGTHEHEPAIKPEDPYHHQVDAVPQHDLPSSTPAKPHQSALSATSPQSENGWMSTSSSDHTEKPIKRDNIPFFVDNPPRLRPDGVRKKNARFEIPEDRKVDTIDRIIMQTDPSNELLLKELKQQKRLLRNRQAALDSRSRKKEHTAKLEEERKILVHNLETFQEELHHYRQQETLWLQERASWHATVEQLRLEQEELVRKHTLETADLRKKNNALMEDAQRRPSLSMSAVPSSAGYSSTFSEFDHLSVDDSPTWDDFSLLHHAQTEQDVPKPKKLTATTQPKDDSISREDDKSAASGLLLTLLLCGAWVASKGSTSAVGMPQMPEDVRAASTTVLDNIYKDAGLAVPSDNDNNMAIIKTQTPHQHAMNQAFNQPNHPFSTFNHLSAPSLQQQRDEVFSLTPTQYNAITTDDSLYSTPQASSPKNRRNLQDALSAMRLSRKGTASEAYTKSLMWDEVPTNVIRDFARMVGERNTEPLS